MRANRAIGPADGFKVLAGGFFVVKFGHFQLGHLRQLLMPKSIRAFASCVKDIIGWRPTEVAAWTGVAAMAGEGSASTSVT